MLPAPWSTLRPSLSCFFFFNDTATTEIYTLSLHDALPIYHRHLVLLGDRRAGEHVEARVRPEQDIDLVRSEEHTSELQSRSDLVCRLLLEKKKTRRPNRSQTRPKTQRQSAHIHGASPVTHA